MPESDVTNLARVICEFIKDSPRLILFSGAGVSSALGVPAWRGLMEDLSGYLEESGDNASAALMMDAVEEGDFLAAATYYFMSRRLTDPDKYQKLSEIFTYGSLDPIRCISKIPFTSYVTTNYDKSLNDLYAQSASHAAGDYYQVDGSLAAAQMSNDFYVARIHGKAEIPTSIVLSKEHYENLSENEGYKSFLQAIFTRAKVLFIGFSFLDPAIAEVLEVIYQKVSVYHRGRHLALVPEGANQSLLGRLNKYGIRKESYPDRNDHQVLWNALRVVADSCDFGEITEGADQARRAEMKRYFAACYTRLKLSGRSESLRHTVVEGICSKLIEEAGDKGISYSELVDKTDKLVGATTEEFTPLLRTGLESLAKDSLISSEINNDSVVYRWLGQDHDTAESLALKCLSEAIYERYVVREGGKVNKIEYDELLTNFWSKLIERRGWDLGVHFLDRSSPKNLTDDYVISLFRSLNSTLSEPEQQRLGRAAFDVVRRPSPEQAEALADLGRVSFALELALNAAPDEIFRRAALPDRVYLDANVLLRATTQGHPFYNLYNSSINRLIELALRSGIALNVCVYEGFLHEILYQRNKAEEDFKEFDPGLASASIKRNAYLRATEGLNVFVVGYGMKLRENPKLSFSDYLRETAPYSTVNQLEAWLIAKGMTIIRRLEMATPETGYPEIYGYLERAYEGGDKRKSKGARQIENDATQLAGLNFDRNGDRKSFFITGDRELARIIRRSAFGYLSESMVSRESLIQLIDLIVGQGEDNNQAVAKVLWCATLSSEAEQVRSYFIDQGLSHFDEAMAMAIPEIVDKFADEFVRETHRIGVNINDSDPEKRIRAERLLEEFEGMFFTGMREVIEKRRRQLEE